MCLQWKLSARARWRARAGLWVGLAAAPRAEAQVNVEGLRKELTGEGVRGRASGSLVSRRGNTTGLELGASGLVAWRSALHLAYLSTSANYSHLGGELQVANVFGHLRYGYQLQQWLSAEVFVQGESDRFRRLRLRTLAGLGPRLTLLDDEVVSVFYGVSYMYEHNTIGRGLEPVRPANVHRCNNYVSLVVALQPERAMISNTIYVQPRFDAVRDVRLLEVFSLEASVSGRLTAGLHLTLTYENPVPAAVESADLVVRNTLGVAF